MSIQQRSRISLLVLFAVLACLIGLTLKPLASQVRFGLEFRGGYEIYYVIDPLPGHSTISDPERLATIDILRQRADSIGMSEPEIQLEGANHIRLKLAGLTWADESRSNLGNPAGLPVKLTEKYTQTVGSVLGRTALAETLTAGLLGIACIFALLIGLYRSLGVIAALATVVYLWLLLILFTSMHATLSLSAVVAFVLGIGIAADASIICFERIREQLAQHSDLKQAVRGGFAGSFGTIRDANLVTGLAMLALFAAGIGPIQGFSLTLLASILIGIATNFFLVRQLALWLADSGWLSSRLLIGSAKREKPANSRTFNYTGLGSSTILVVLLVIASGSLYYRAHGLNLDIDFTSGTALDIDLDRAIDQDTATRVISDAGTVPATLAVGGEHATHIAARFDEVLKPAELQAIISAFQQQYRTVEYEENTADPGVARDFANRALLAICAALLSICLFLSLRFNWRMAVATSLPIVLDILLVSAIFVLGKFEVDVTYIAAILTVIGYSLNDKIVIFGRIHENLRNSTTPPSASALHPLVNRSISQTLGRSLYTVLTVLMASACLYLFACEPLQMFALALMIGLLSGACSSIFISSFIWLALQHHGQPHSPAELHGRWLFAGLALAIVLGSSAAWLALPRLLPSASSNIVHAANLGDLAAYALIAQDALQLVQQGALPAAKARMKNLETAWDQAEEQLQPRNPDDWKAVDKAIDRALSQVRSGQPIAADCAAALEALLAQIASKQASSASASSGLGDLSAYAVIAQDALTLAQQGDMPAIKARMKDLESAWDLNKARLQGLDAEAWGSIDKSIDRALAPLRTAAPEQQASVSALQALLGKIHSK
jgi:preprotein translocase SecF subunit